MSRDEVVARLDELLAADHDYNSSAEAAREATVIVFDLMADQLGLTGFQAEWASLKAYGEILHIDGPFGVVRGENMLYPQYDEVGKVRKWQGEWSDWLRDEARKRLSERSLASPRVVEHWQRLAAL